MVDIQSKEVIDKIAEDLKVQPSMQIPRALAKEIQLSYNVNPERDITIAAAAAIDAGAQIMLTHATKRTFIVGASLSISKDVVSDSIFSKITLFPKGKAVTPIISIRYEPLIALSNLTHCLSLPFPIELDKSSSIAITHESGTASIDGEGIIFFFEVDPL